MTTFELPDLGEGLQEAEIVEWHVAIGDTVVADQPLLSVETDKAVVEVPSPYSGRIVTLHGNPGDIVGIGAPLVDFDQAESTDSGTVVGEIPRDEERIDETAEQERPGRAKVKATPAVRALARKLDVDLSAVAPSGPSGIITADDIKRVAALLSEAGPPEPLHGVRRTMARKMEQAHGEAVPATLFDDADVDSWPEAVDVTVRLIRAIAAACRAEPALNGWYDSRETSRRLIGKIDVGIAVDTGDGLFVPVMRDVGNRDDTDLRRGIEALKRDVVARDIPVEELRGATISLSNFGTFGAGRYAAQVIMPPQVAILGAGRIAPTIVAVDGGPAVRRVLPVSVTFDHRVVTGAEAARFLAAMIGDLVDRI